MSLILTVPDDIATVAQEMAKGTDATPEELLLEALKAHFPATPADLQAEFDAWDKASDEDFARLAGEEYL